MADIKNKHQSFEAIVSPSATAAQVLDLESPPSNTKSPRDVRTIVFLASLKLNHITSPTSRPHLQPSLRKYCTRTVLIIWVVLIKWVAAVVTEKAALHASLWSHSRTFWVFCWVVFFNHKFWGENILSTQAACPCIIPDNHLQPAFEDLFPFPVCVFDWMIQTATWWLSEMFVSCHREEHTVVELDTRLRLGEPNAIVKKTFAYCSVSQGWISGGFSHVCFICSVDAVQRGVSGSPLRSSCSRECCAAERPVLSRVVSKSL